MLILCHLFYFFVFVHFNYKLAFKLCCMHLYYLPMYIQNAAEIHANNGTLSCVFFQIEKYAYSMFSNSNISLFNLFVLLIV